MTTASIQAELREGIRAAYQLTRHQSSEAELEEEMIRLAAMDLQDGGDRIAHFCAEFCKNAVDGWGANIFDLPTQKQLAIIKAHQVFVALNAFKDFAADEARHMEDVPEEELA